MWYLSYLDVVSSSLISANLSPSEMLVMYAMTKNWDRFSRQIKGAVISGPTRSLSQRTKLFGLQKILVETQSFCRLDVRELVLRAIFVEGCKKLRTTEIVHQSNNSMVAQISSSKRMESIFMVKDVCCSKYTLHGAE